MSDFIQPNTPSDDFTELLKQQSACQTAIDWCTKHSGLTVDQLLDDFQTDEEAEASWATWALLVLGDKIDLDIRKKFLDKIKNSGWAFFLYCKLSWLTDEEDELLLAKFKGEVPEGEKLLSQGIIKREKDGGHSL